MEASGAAVVPLDYTRFRNIQNFYLVLQDIFDAEMKNHFEQPKTLHKYEVFTNYVPDVLIRCCIYIPTSESA